ncbi:hypothetical protein evm_014985 [Chilo suppressalis]|nr:hypothetical protein evm_014985 [Chilo suppressalis]
MEVAFIKADSRNLPRVSVDMVTTFFVQSAEFLSVEMKRTKLLRYVKIVVVKLRILFSGFYKSYGDNAIGYVQIKRDGELCTFSADTGLCSRRRNPGVNFPITESQVEECMESGAALAALGAGLDAARVRRALARRLRSTG